jgi:hypothetical protein
MATTPAVAERTDHEQIRVPRPEGTVFTFVLLTLLVVLSGVFVGEWLLLILDAHPAGARLAWLAGVPAFVLALTVLLVLSQPWLTLRRQHLTPVAADAPGTRRFADLVRRAEVRRSPQLVWNLGDPSVGALAFGRPGRYCVRVSPALLGAARRRPATFDAVLSHELGHVRSHDVGMTYFALYCWYALLPVLAVPLVIRLVGGDRSLVPDYLFRVAILAAAVYLVRARLLRVREHYADLRAAAWSQMPGDYASVLVSAPGSTSVRRRPKPTWLALHPEPARRQAVVLEPRELARPDVTMFLVGGFATGAGLVLLQSLLVTVPGMTALTADRVARVGMFALLGAGSAAEILRWAGAYRPAERRGSAFAGAALALSAGVVLGALTSVGGTGLVEGSVFNARALGLTAVMVAALLMVSTDLVSGLLDRRAQPATSFVIAAVIVSGAVMAGLLADACLAGSAFLAAGATDLVLTQLAYVVAQGGSILVLAILVAVVAAFTAPRRSLRAATAIAVLGGVVAAVSCLAVRARVGQPPDEVLVRFYTAATWIVVLLAVGAAVVATVRWAASTGFVVMVGAVLVGVGGFALVVDAFGGNYDMVESAALVRDWGSLAVALGLPALALAVGVRRSLARGVPDQGPDPAVREIQPVGTVGRLRRPTVVVPAVLGLVVIAAISVWVPGAVRGQTVAVRTPMATYLAAEVPLLVSMRNTAFYAGEQAVVVPQVSVSSDIRSGTIPLYEQALAQARETSGYPYVHDDPAVSLLNAAFIRVVMAEQDAFSAKAEASDHPSAENEKAAQHADANALKALASWQALLGVARAGSR